jgi:hypothetical protein
MLGVHCHCCEDMKDGSGFVRNGEAQRWPLPRFPLDVGTRLSHYPCPSPHAATEKEQEPAASLGKQGAAECGAAQCFVLRHGAPQPRKLYCIVRQRTVFFTATARSIVLG